MSTNKVIVIGIDGGTFDVILPMIKEGKLPILGSLMKKGMWGELESTIPANTGPAWVSMMTGVNPGKHGIFFFLGNLHNNYMNSRILGSMDIKFPPLWSVLSRNGKKVIFVNVPFTYPPMEVNGILISGMLIPESAEIVSYPPHIYWSIFNRLNKYDINDWESKEMVGEDLSTSNTYYDKMIEFLSKATEYRKKATLMLLEENEWDFLMVVFTSVDRLQHLFWKFMDNSDGSSNNKLLSKYRYAIHDGYRELDNAIGEILDKVGNDTTVMIVSDHGFGSAKKDFYVNKWLEEIGLFKTKKDLGPRKIKLSVSLHTLLKKILPETSNLKWAERIPIFLPRSVARDRDEMIDWEKTKAYANEFGININLRGREPYGVVKPGREAEELLVLIQKQFYQLVDESESKDKIADWILRKEQIYDGPFMEEASDLYLSAKEESYLIRTKIDADAIFSKSYVKKVSGIHRMNGICVMSSRYGGRDDTFRPRIVDIAPTIQYLMGLPVLEEIDGRVLEEIIDPDYLKSKPIKQIKPWEYGGKTSAYSAEDEEKIKEDLKGLGYL